MLHSQKIIKEKRMNNRLKDEESPYLLQHADNIVDWYPWGEEAFEKAQRENKAIFVSVGYSSCHWCHVMRRESFEDREIADRLNRDFVSIKVDREERPDIDKHFQSIYQLMNGRPGGWPTSIFLTSNKRPFYLATYIPPTPRYGMMGFGELLETIEQKYSTQKETLIQKGDEILSSIDPIKDKIQATKLDISILNRFTQQAEQLFDKEYGGFNKAPKFPQTSILDLLLDSYLITNSSDTLKMVTNTLDAMSRGGLYDIIDGGFCRYSTDDRWLVPHFEKMTYDNALLSQLYIRAYHITKESRYRDIANKSIEFMLSKMSSDNLFFTASDADSGGGEGRYFTYSYDEVAELFRREGISSEMLDTLGITKEGNFEGQNILSKVIDRDIPSKVIELLKGLRANREYPFVDEKIIVSWNAMMIKSLFKASRISNNIDERYLSQAINSLGMLLDRLYINSELFHSTIGDKKPKIRAFLEDYAYLCDTLIEAYQTTLNESYLILATKLANSAIERFYVGGQWKFSRGEFETNASIYDSSYPSSMAVMLSSLYSISSLVDIVYKKFVFKSLEINSFDIMRQPISNPKIAQMVIRYLKDDIILKATDDKLKYHLADIEALPYPYTLVRTDSNDGFMICNSSSCFGHERDFDGVREVI
jgi:uncharacterized protein YyaL (SSP411 family)